jgi:hypothetical protein
MPRPQRSRPPRDEDRHDAERAVAIGTAAGHAVAHARGYRNSSKSIPRKTIAALPRARLASRQVPSEATTKPPGYPADRLSGHDQAVIGTAAVRAEARAAGRTQAGVAKAGGSGEHGREWRSHGRVRSRR